MCGATPLSSASRGAILLVAVGPPLFHATDRNGHFCHLFAAAKGHAARCRRGRLLAAPGGDKLLFQVAYGAGYLVCFSPRLEGGQTDSFVENSVSLYTG